MTYTDDIRTRHYANPTAVQVDGVPVPCCQSCWAPYPCDAIRLADVLDEARAVVADLQAVIAGQILEITEQAAEVERADFGLVQGAIAKTREQAAEIERLRVLPTRDEIANAVLADVPITAGRSLLIADSVLALLAERQS